MATYRADVSPLDDTQTHDAQQARDVAGAILWMSQMSNVRRFFRNGESQRNGLVPAKATCPQSSSKIATAD